MAEPGVPVVSVPDWAATVTEPTRGKAAGAAAAGAALLMSIIMSMPARIISRAPVLNGLENNLFVFMLFSLALMDNRWVLADRSADK